MFISDFAIKRPLITVVAMVSLVIFGMFALMKLKTDEFPDVAPPWLTVAEVLGRPHVLSCVIASRAETSRCWPRCVRCRWMSAERMAKTPITDAASLGTDPGINNGGFVGRPEPASHPDNAKMTSSVAT